MKAPCTFPRSCRAFFCGLLLALAPFLFSCASSDDSESAGLSVALPGEARGGTYTRSDVVIFEVEISSDSVTRTKFGAPGTTVFFENVPIGTYDIVAVGKNAAGSTAARARTRAEVTEGATTAATANLSLLKWWEVKFIYSEQVDMTVTKTEVKVVNVTDGETVEPPDSRNWKYTVGIDPETSRVAEAPFTSSIPITKNMEVTTEESL